VQRQSHTDEGQVCPLIPSSSGNLNQFWTVFSRLSTFLTGTVKSFPLNGDCSLSLNDLKQAVSYLGKNFRTAGMLQSPCWSTEGSIGQVSVTFVLCVTMQHLYCV